MKRAKQEKCALGPQKIDRENWYYEYPGSIHLIAVVPPIKDCVTLEIKIPRRMLEASLKRMNASRRKR